MKKKLITSTLCLVLLLIMMLSTTLAWFTDTQGSVNTMVAGKISIDMVCQDWEDLVMMPGVKYPTNVEVTNTGNQPCYVRTLFAFEDSNTVDILKLIKTNNNIEIPGITNNDAKIQFTVTKGSETTIFTVGYSVNETAMEEDDCFNPMTAVGLDPKAENVWHETVGTHYELFILSQATQVAGIDTVASTAQKALDVAFAEITGVNCATWFARVLGGTASGETITVANP